ncbi:MAG: phosphoglucomutase/phosphomannomutase family protein [Candidatus Sumerlaeia bacterium]
MTTTRQRSSQPHAIRFGTDGWRAIIADQFTFDHVRAIAQAVADYLHECGGAACGLAVGFDTRFLSQDFARVLAEVVAGNGIPVLLSRSWIPTPALSLAVVQRGLAGGVMITASHNPFRYNGVKFKAGWGGPAPVEMTRAIEGHLFKRAPRLDSRRIRAHLELCDFRKEYFRRLSDLVRFRILQAEARTVQCVAFDSMNGAGAGWAEALFERALGRGRTLSVRGHSTNPLFPDCHGPEPIAANLRPLASICRRNRCVGFATDGDADRFGVLDERGRFVQLHDLMPLLFEYLVESRGWRGAVIRTTSMAATVDQMAAAMGRASVEVPVGFKNVSEKMREMEFVIAGEESGGFGYQGHIPERDGILSCLLALEMLAVRDRPMSGLVRALRRRFGPFAYDRIDEYGDLSALRARLRALRRAPPDRVGAFRVERVTLIDGIKLYFAGGAWMLIRVSDTEPLFRVYVAGRSAGVVKQILDEGRRLMTGP